MGTSNGKTICIDFDGTIAAYDRWRGKGEYGAPVPGVSCFLQGLKDAGWTIVINTTRNNENDTIAEYLRKLEAPYDHINYSPENLAQDLSPTKLIGDVYLDDRNIEFNGSYDGLLKKVIDFKPWWRRIAKDA